MFKAKYLGKKNEKRHWLLNSYYLKRVTINMNDITVFIRSLQLSSVCLVSVYIWMQKKILTNWYYNIHTRFFFPVSSIVLLVFALLLVLFPSCSRSTPAKTINWVLFLPLSLVPLKHMPYMPPESLPNFQISLSLRLKPLNNYYAEDKV